MNCNAVGSFKPSDDYIWITWSLLSKCNLSCDYCTAKGNYWPDMQQIMRGLFFIERLPYTSKEVILFGGEPTLILGIELVVDYLKEIGAKTSIFTNIIKSETLLTLNEECRITATYHPDMMKSEVFIGNMEKLHKYKFNFVNVMMYGMEEEEYKVCKYLLERKIPHRRVPIWGNSSFADWLKSVEYTYSLPDELSMRNIHACMQDGSIRKATEQELVLSEMTNFKGWDCYAGVNSIYINHDGNVYKCQEDLNQGKILCTVEDELPKLNSLTCNHDRCTCEYYIPKRLPNAVFNW